MKNEKSASDHTLDVTLKRVDELHHQVEELKAQLLTKGNHKKVAQKRVRNVPSTDDDHSRDRLSSADRPDLPRPSPSNSSFFNSHWFYQTQQKTCESQTIGLFYNCSQLIIPTAENPKLVMYRYISRLLTCLQIRKHM